MKDNNVKASNRFFFKNFFSLQMCKFIVLLFFFIKIALLKEHVISATFTDGGSTCLVITTAPLAYFSLPFPPNLTLSIAFSLQTLICI